jgi:hypothetical protein
MRTCQQSSSDCNEIRETLKKRGWSDRNAKRQRVEFATGLESSVFSLPIPRGFSSRATLAFGILGIQNLQIRVDSLMERNADSGARTFLSASRRRTGRTERKECCRSISVRSMRYLCLILLAMLAGFFFHRFGPL